MLQLVNAKDFIGVMLDIRGLDNMTELNVVCANNLREKIWPIFGKNSKKAGFFVLKLEQFGVFVGVFGSRLLPSPSRKK